MKKVSMKHLERINTYKDVTVGDMVFVVRNKVGPTSVNLQLVEIIMITKESIFPIKVISWNGSVFGVDYEDILSFYSSERPQLNSDNTEMEVC